jgi:hypothetical protein
MHLCPLTCSHRLRNLCVTRCLPYPVVRRKMHPPNKNREVPNDLGSVDKVVGRGRFDHGIDGITGPCR